MKKHCFLNGLLLLTFVSFVNMLQAQETPANTQQSQVEVTKVAEGVYGIFSTAYNSLVVIGTDRVAITDPAFPNRARVLKHEIAKLTDKPITDIILSHEHYDHIGGTQVFPDADIHCHALCVDIFTLDTINMVPKKELQTYDKHKTIDLGQQIIELNHYGPSDGVANTVIYLPKQKILYTADIYAGSKYLVPGFIPLDDQNLLGVRSVLKKLLELDVEYAMDAHSPLTDPTELKRYAAFIEDVYMISEDWIEKTMPRDTTVMEFLTKVDAFSRSVDLPQYKDWENYDSLHKYVVRMISSIMHGG